MIFQVDIQFVMIVTFVKLNIIYAQEQKNMPVVIKKVPFTTILTTAVITAVLKIFRFNNDSFDKALLSINSV